MDTGGLIIISGMISDLDHAFCSPYIFCTRSQRVAALVSQIQITVRRASLSTKKMGCIGFSNAQLSKACKSSENARQNQFGQIGWERFCKFGSVERPEITLTRSPVDPIMALVSSNSKCIEFKMLESIGLEGKAIWPGQIRQMQPKAAHSPDFGK